MKSVFKNPLMKAQLTAVGMHLFTLVKWIVMGVVTGLILGLVGSVFGLCLEAVTEFRAEHSWILYLLPVAGVLIVFLYQVTRNNRDTGTNMVIEALHSSTQISYKMAPLIFVSTILTHLCGGSAGREGAALQLGGSISNFLSDIPFFRFNEADKRTNIMCGMSAGFAALFGTPLAAAIFSLEVAHVGMMQYSSMVPCIISAFTASFVSRAFGLHPEAFAVDFVPAFTPKMLLLFLLFGAVLGAVSILFFSSMHEIDHLYKKWLPNKYLRIAVAGVLINVLVILVGSRRYLGSGVGIIEHIFETGNPEAFYSFLLKLLFTAVTLCAGFKGGEIVPSFCVGAAFGSWVGGLLGMPIPLMAACGMAGVFCGVTNCPITTTLIAFEMFGFEGMPFYVVTIAVSYMLSGYGSLYHTQQVMFSKVRYTNH